MLRLAVAGSPLRTADIALSLAWSGPLAKAEDIQHFDLFFSGQVAVVDLGGDLVAGEQIAVHRIVVLFA